MDDLIALAGDLLYEKKCLHDKFERVEQLLLRSEDGKQLLKQLGSIRSENIYADLEQASASIDRVGAIAKTLVKEFSRSKLVSALPYASKIESELYRLADEKQRQVSCIAKVNCQGVDGAYFDEFIPILNEFLSAIVEFGIESERERAARGKAPICQVSVELSSTEETTLLVFRWNGNGIQPPFLPQSGKKMSSLGGRVNFSGVLSESSVLECIFPISVGSIRGVTLNLAGRRVCLPFWAVTHFEKLQTIPDNQFFTLNADLNIVDGNRISDLGVNLHKISVASGLKKIDLILPVDNSVEEMFLKPLAPQFTSNGRFLGVVASEQNAELRLILNPAFLVYRSDGEVKQVTDIKSGGVLGK